MPDIKVTITGDGGSAAAAFQQAGDGAKHMAEQAAEAAEKLRKLVEFAESAKEAVVDFVKESIHAFMEMEKEQKQLEFVAGDVAEAFEAQAEAMEQALGVSSEMIMHMDALALRYGVARDQIEPMTAALVDWAAATGGDATGAMQALIRAVDQGHGAVKSLGIQFEITGDKTVDMQNAIDALNAKVSGAAGIQAGTLAGRAQNAANAWEDLQKAVGSAFDLMDRKLGILDSMSAGIRHFTDGLKLQAQSWVSFGETVGGVLDKLEEKSKSIHLPGMGSLMDAGKSIKGMLAGEESLYLPAPVTHENHMSEVPAVEVKRQAKAEKDALEAAEKIRKENYDSMQKWMGEDDQLEEETRHNKIESDKKYFAEVAKLEFEANKKDEERSTRDEAEQVARVEREEAARLKAKEHADEAFMKQVEKVDEKRLKEAERASEKLMREEESANKKLHDEMAQAAQQIGMVFVNNLNSALETALEGGEVDVIGTAMDIAFGVAAALGTLLGSVYGSPALGSAIGAAIGGVGTLAHTARAHSWKEEQASQGKKHDGGWMERFHSGGWPGLSSEEQMIISQEGERMLSRPEVARIGGRQAVDQMARGGGSGGTVVVQAIDSSSMVEMFQGRMGRAAYNSVRLGRGMMTPLFS